MADKEISVSHDSITNPQTITKVVDKAFKDAGLDMHRHEAKHEDDFGSRKRVYKIKNVKFFDMGRRSAR